MIEDLQICILKLGYLTNYIVSEEKYKNKPYTRYSIYYHPNKKDWGNTIYYRKPILTHCNGFVYCITLNKNGFFLIRRNNKICFSGNCSNSLSIKFYNKCCGLGDYIAFIQPISQLNNNIQMYSFDLIYSEDLGMIKYSDRELHCCFNIYKRPKNGLLNSKTDYTLKDVTIIEHRRKKGDYQTAKNKPILPNYDYAMCNWGNGSLGKVPNFIGQYAQEVYVYVHKKEYLEKIKQLLEYNTIRSFCNSISSKRISVMRLYKYLKDNIEGIN